MRVKPRNRKPYYNVTDLYYMLVWEITFFRWEVFFYFFLLRSLTRDLLFIFLKNIYILSGEKLNLSFFLLFFFWGTKTIAIKSCIMLYIQKAHFKKVPLYYLKIMAFRDLAIIALKQCFPLLKYRKKNYYRIELSSRLR